MIWSATVLAARSANTPARGTARRRSHRRVRVVRAYHRPQSNTPESPMPLPPDAHLNLSCACSRERLSHETPKRCSVLGDRLREDIVRVVQHDGPADVVVDRPALLSGQEHDERHQASEGD